MPARAKPNFSILYEFTGGVDGDGGAVAMLQDPSKVIYGVSGNGGTATCGTSRCGAIFSLTPPAGGKGRYSFASIYNFSGAADGADPAGDQVVQGPDGALYGTAQFGGLATYPFGGGVVWRLTTAGGTFTYSVLHAFNTAADPAGYRPVAGLAIDSAGVLYGITTRGTASDSGAVFSLTPPAGGTGKWTEAVLHLFPTVQKSAAVHSPTLSHNELRLFAPSAVGGFVFELQRKSVSSPWAFRSIADTGATARNFSNLTVDTRSGDVFGVVQPGGANGSGAAVVILPPAAGSQGWTLVDNYNFGVPTPGLPTGRIVQGDQLQVYGTITGSPDQIYQLTPPAGGSGEWTFTSLRDLDSSPKGILSPAGLYPGLAGNLLGATLPTSSTSFGVIFRQTIK